MYLPSRRQFREWTRRKQAVPVAACLPLEHSVQAVFEAVAFRPPHILLESARTDPVTGRYSILVGEPAAILTAKGNRISLQTDSDNRTFYANPLEELQKVLEARQAVRIPCFPPFVGGAVGFLGFDCYRAIEPSLPQRAANDLPLPDLGFFFFDEAIVLDHMEKKLWIVALALSSRNPDAAYDETVGRIDALLKRLGRATGDAGGEPCAASPADGWSQTDAREDAGCGDSTSGRTDGPVSLESSHERMESTHTRASFERMVRQAKQFIARGDIYQANLSQRFKLPVADEPWALYKRLTSLNPSPFAAYADFSAIRQDSWWSSLQMISASPERFLRVRGRNVETRPIAGTRPKGWTVEETQRMRETLLLNPKERAEHLMLVDLSRNDLGRVCRYGSVEVNEWMALEEYSHVIHIVSNVRGVLRPRIRLMDLIAATFPGGTITGCPKIRSMEIIDLLEPVRRQLYTGSLGFVSATGDLDLNLLIRTAFVVGRLAYIQAGAGIVADSDPSREYDETLHKAQALLEAFEPHAPVSEQLVMAS